MLCCTGLGFPSRKLGNRLWDERLTGEPQMFKMLKIRLANALPPALAVNHAGPGHLLFHSFFLSFFYIFFYIFLFFFYFFFSCLNLSQSHVIRRNLCEDT
jgi:hypothetical protein